MSNPRTDLELWIDSGYATSNDIAEFLVALSELHRAAGGPGLDYHVDEKRTLKTSNGRVLVAIVATPCRSLFDKPDGATS